VFNAIGSVRLSGKRVLWLLLSGVGLVAVGGCADLTRVTDPAIVQPSDLDNPSGALALQAGALSRLFQYFSQASFTTGLLADEFYATPADAGNYPEDARDLSVTTTNGTPFRLEEARVDALIAIAQLKRYAPSPASSIGELYALVAATEVFFTESLCNGVPVATVSGTTATYGPTLSRSQLIAQALEDLDSAAAYSTQSDSIANLAAVLHARILLDSGDVPSAARVVATVPITFVYTAQLDDTTSENNVYVNITGQRASTSDREGINGLPFVSTQDPRLPTVAIPSSSGTLYIPANANSGSAPLVLASGVEVQLVVAEAELAAHNATAWASTLNALRASGLAGPMTPLPADSTTSASPATQLLVMFRERAFWLFGTGHRLGDLRRLVRQYGLPVEGVFPTGLYEGGPATYGTSVLWPIAAGTGYSGCTDTNP
jgi:hypothetical protein